MQFRKPRFHNAIIAFGLTALLAESAAAQSLNVSASVGPRFGGGSGSSQSQTLSGSEAIAAGAIQAGAAGGNVLLPALADIPFGVLPSGPVSAGLNSGAQARLSAGSIGVQTFAQAAGYVVVPSGGSAANYLANSSASVSFQDSFTVLGDGTVTTRLLAETLFDTQQSVLALRDQAAGASINFYSKIEYYWTGGGSASFVTCSGWSYYCPTSDPDGLHSFVRDVLVAAGTTFWVNTTMSASAEAGLYNAIDNSITGGIASARVDSWQSLRHGVELLTPGARLTSASGHNYVFQPHATAVPEPATTALMAAGLAAIGIGARRRRPARQG